MIVPVEFPGRALPMVEVKPAEGDAAADKTADGVNKRRRMAIIDTGAFCTPVTPDYAKARRFLVTGTIEFGLVDAYGTMQRNPRLARVTSLPLDGVTLHRFDALVHPLTFMQSDDQEVVAFLGAPVFRDVLLTIDYPNRRMILDPAGALPPPDGKHVLPMKVDESGHLMIPLVIQGRETWMMLDTGYTNDGLLLHRSRLAGIPWTVQPVTGDLVTGGMAAENSYMGRMAGQVTLGGYALHEPIIAISFSPTKQEMIGASILKDFVVTIDQRNGRIKFDGPPPAEPILADSVMGWGFHFSDASGAVVILPHSAAAEAGMRTGDRVTTLNGVALEKWTYKLMNQVQQSGKPLNVGVMRGDEALSFEVMQTVFVR